MAVTITKPEGGAPTPKKSELAAVLEQIKKDKGDGVIMCGKEVPVVNRIPTGIFEFDFATGGGFPEGRLSIVYGPESSGKTNHCLKAVATMQRRPGPNNKCVWIDLEQCFDPVWAAALGVNVDELIVIKPAYGEEAVDMVDAVLRADDTALVIVDSIAVMIAVKEVEQSTETADVGTSPLLNKRLCNKVLAGLGMEGRRKHFPTVIFVNQTRMKIGVIKGNPETMPGGMTQKFAAAMIVRLSGRNKMVKEISSELPAFKETTCVIKKAKVPIRQSETEYDLAMQKTDRLDPGESLSWNSVMNHLKSLGILTKAQKGQGWTLLGQSFPTLIPIQDTYEAEPEYALKLQQTVIEAYKGKTFMIDPPIEQL